MVVYFKKNLNLFIIFYAFTIHTFIIFHNMKAFMTIFFFLFVFDEIQFFHLDLS